METQNAQFPTVWTKFKGKKEVDGSIPEFWIQDIPDDRHEDVVQLMKKCFLLEEPLCKCSAVPSELLAEFNRNVLKHKLSLGCFTKDSNDSKPVLVGVNLLKMNDDDSVEKEEDNRLRKVIKYIKNYKDPFKTLGITDYLYAAGLAVLPEYRGQNIGLELLKARFILMKALGIKNTMTLFTSGRSQILAEKAGFEDFVTIEYEQIWRDRPDIKIPGLSEESKCCKFMYKFVE